MTYDGNHNYTYDAENRIIAVDGGNTASYVYNAEGERAQRTVSGVSTQYHYDSRGRVVAEYDGGCGPTCWNTGYVYINGQMKAEYKNSTTYFVHSDLLGSTRLLTGYPSPSIIDCDDYYPFGELISCGGTTTLTRKFTGKQRDAESNLDYFGARYYGSSLGRWIMPDRLNLTDDRVMSPSSTLNKYSYGGENPFRFVDPDGKDIVALYEPPSYPTSAGHFMLFANNPVNGESAMMSFGELDSSVGGKAILLTGAPVSATSTFGWPQNAADLRNGYAALTIQTSPEEAQEVINWIKNFSPSSTDYRLYSNNCTTVCRDALKALGLVPKNNTQITPSSFWSTLFNRYSRNNFQNRFLKALGFVPQYGGRDYGNPRFGMDTFDFIMLQLNPPCTESWDPKTNTLHGCP